MATTFLIDLYVQKTRKTVCFVIDERFGLWLKCNLTLGLMHLYNLYRPICITKVYIFSCQVLL
jgi:hypothetical protein